LKKRRRDAPMLGAYRRGRVDHQVLQSVRPEISEATPRGSLHAAVQRLVRAGPAWRWGCCCTLLLYSARHECMSSGVAYVTGSEPDTGLMTPGCRAVGRVAARGDESLVFVAHLHPFDQQT